MWDPSIGLDWVLICFAALCVMVIAFVFRYLPETQTQGLSLEQIVEEFEREAQKTGVPVLGQGRRAHRCPALARAE